MKILLINPGNPAQAGRDLYTADIHSALCRFTVNKKMCFGIPLALPTIAGVTPKHHTVKIIDEMIEAIDFSEKCDLMGITAMTYKATRAYEIAAAFRKRGVPVVMGGIHASMCPDEAAKHVDCVVIGEADNLWPRLLGDFERGNLLAQYKAESPPDVSKLPPPRYDLTNHDGYLVFFLQTTRGCPYSCKFCTVTEFNGKAIRKKSPEQVIQEIETVLPLRKLHLRLIDMDEGRKRKKLATTCIFFTDDNFAINRKHALEICKAITDYQKEKGIVISWFTQVNYEVGLDNELLTAMRSAGCFQLFMGFESLDPNALKALKKTMNSPERYASSIKNTRQHGMEVVFSIILGSDHDTTMVGDEIARFVEQNNIFLVLPNILTPYPGTVLRKEMDKDERIVQYSPEYYNIRNVVFQPKMMTPIELQRVYTDLCKRIFSIEKMLPRGKKATSYKKRYYIAPVGRIIVVFLFSLSAVRVALKGKITFRALLKLLRYAPGMLILDGSLISLNILAVSADYDSYVHSEVDRFKISPAAQLAESKQKKFTNS